MNCILNIAGKNSNDIYQINAPSNLLGFCKFDFTRFMEESNRLCHECMKTGEYPIDEVNVIRNSITTCHRYYENNMRGLFDKIVVDCWIEYICRQGEIGTSTLWNSFAECQNPFQKVIFQRLSEYRAHRAINQWVNLLKMQEYAQKKLDYVFGGRLNGVAEAAAKLNFFDLMFSVAANEQGYSLDTVSSIKVCKPGRLSTAPFVYSGAAKEIIRNLFKSVRFAESQPYVSREEGVMSDWEAMDAFSMIKSYLPDSMDNVVKTIMKTIVKLPETVYMPSGFKAVIDLEIDAVLNNGAFLQRCRRCNEYYVRDANYTSDYCDNPQRDGRTCRGIMEQPKFEPPSDEEMEVLQEKTDSLYKEVSERVGKDIAQKDFIEWSGYFNVIKNKVFSGEASLADFDDFIVYTNQFSFPPIEEEPEPENAENEDKPDNTEAEKEEEEVEISADGKKVKPYQFTRIDRKELEQSGLLKPAEKQEEAQSPVVKEVVAAAPPPVPVAKIIRGGISASYRELPARPISNGDSKAEVREEFPIKKDVYIGEDFSLSGNAAANTFPPQREAPAAPINTETKKKPDSDTHFLPDLDQFTDFSDIDETESRRAKAPKVKLPTFGKPEEEKLPTDSEGFKDLFAESEKRTQTERPERPFPKTISEMLAESKAEEESKESRDTSDIEKWVNRLERLRSDRRDEPDGNAKGEITAERIEGQAEGRIENRQEEQTKEERKAEWQEERQNDLTDERPKPRGSAYSRYSASSAYSGSRINPVRTVTDRRSDEISQTRFEDMGDLTEEIDLTTDMPVIEKDSGVPEKERVAAEKPVNTEFNRAARAVSAYKTVTDMPVSHSADRAEESLGKEKIVGPSEDFARILDSIERNDGFEEESLPLDPDGVPLSHKTKHVMDAIMKNTAVSPSLVYGRRQAAEKNVVLDESFGEKKK